MSNKSSRDTIPESVIRSSPWWVEVETRDVYDPAAGAWEELTYYYLTNGKVRAMMLEDPSEVTSRLRELYPRTVEWWVEHHQPYASQNEFYAMFSCAQWRVVYEEAARRINDADWIEWRRSPWNRRTTVVFQREEPQPCAVPLGRVHEDLFLLRSAAQAVVEQLHALPSDLENDIIRTIGTLVRVLVAIPPTND